MSNRHNWSISEVVDSIGPAANVRNYLEHRDVRRCLAHASTLRPIRRAADVGCGYGRLTMVLAEFAGDVVGFERETGFVDEARRSQPAHTFVNVDALTSLDAPTGYFDFAMTFTVLQHMRDDEARSVLNEIKRVADGGVVLLTEETDPALLDGLAGDGAVTLGRSPEVYASWMKPYAPVLTFPRTIEPGYPRPDVGTYMLFAHPGLP